MTLPKSYWCKLQPSAYAVVKKVATGGKLTLSDVYILLNDPITSKFPQICAELNELIRKLKFKEVADLIHNKFAKDHVRKLTKLPEEILD